MARIFINEKGNKVVEIDKIKFSGKRKINWAAVEDYLKDYIGKAYALEQMNDVIYVGSEFPDEYANSKYSSKAFGTIGRAKANASQAIPELIKVTTSTFYNANM